jgi:hypothetical protein
MESVISTVSIAYLTTQRVVHQNVFVAGGIYILKSTMAFAKRRLTPLWAQTASISLLFSNTLLLIAYHARAEGEESVLSWTDRLRSGPDGLSTMDKLVLAVLVSLGFELLDFCAKNWGSEFYICSYDRHHFSSFLLLCIFL